MLNRMKLLTALIVLASATTALAADIYVDVQTGSDVTGDGSTQAPWKTITHALTQVSGTVRVVVRPGLYDPAAGEVFPINVQVGTTLESTGGPEATIIRGDGVNHVLELIGQGTDVWVDGFRIESGNSGIRVSIETGKAWLTNNTISGNSFAGVASEGYGTGTQGVVLQGNAIRGNGHGVRNTRFPNSTGLTLSDNLIEANSSHGVYVAGGSIVASSDRDLIRNNGGWGWFQKLQFAGGGSVQSSLTNSTISGNTAGGLYTAGDYACWYFPYIGWRCFDPPASIGANAVVVYGNGGVGAQRSGTSGGAFGQFNNSIVWGNTVTDNLNFKNYDSDIGTGSKSGPGTISAPPLFVDAANGDFRLTRTSPCIDTVIAGFPDFEGEMRPHDGDSDGGSHGDMGADEFHPFVAPGTRAVIGQPFWFFSEAPPADDGQLVFVMISTADGEDSGGIPVPGSQGQRVDLAPDWLFQLGLTVQPALSGTLQNGFAQTATVTLPNSTQFLGPIYYAGATIDLAAGQFKYIMPTHQFSIATQ